MKWKVCGLRDNIDDVANLGPDYVGFIFYPKSPRFVGDDFEMLLIPIGTKKVGVFVNELPEAVLHQVRKYNLDIVQLHGSESPDFCLKIKKEGVEVVKAFAIGDVSDFSSIAQYQHAVDYFLFDTKTEKYGGSGKRFDWRLLGNYTLDKQYFLSGGIDLESISEILKINSPKLHAIDVNSKFFLKPGLKDIQKLKKLKELIKD